MSGALEYVSLDRFGHHIEFQLLPDVSTGNWPVIDPTSFAWSAGAITVLATVIGLLRIILRYNHKKSMDLDDGLFIFAMFCCLLSAILIIYSAEYFYMEGRLVLGKVVFADFRDLVPGVNQYLQILNGVSATAWMSIYSVKFCYLMFFNKLTKGFKGVRLWWWFVLSFTVGSCIVACLIGLWICHDFGTDVLVKCSIPVMNMRAGTWNRISGSTDIATDILIVSIPVFLISKTKINKRRKFAVGTILSLSAAMTIIAFIRMFPPTINILPIDGPWFFFWICIEADIAIIMVSVTAFRSVFKATRIDTNDPKPASRSWGVFSKIRRGMQIGFDRLIAWDQTRIGMIDEDSQKEDVEMGIRVKEEVTQQTTSAASSTLISEPGKTDTVVSTTRPVVSPLTTHEVHDPRDEIRRSWGGGLKSHPPTGHQTIDLDQLLSDKP